MARPRSEFLGSLGKLFSIFKKVVDKVLEQGGSDEDIARLDTDPQLADDIAHLLTKDATILRRKMCHGWVAEMLNEKVICVFPDGSDLKWHLGQRVVAQGHTCVSDGTEGYIVELMLPYEETSDYFLWVLFENRGYAELLQPYCLRHS